ncbi:carbamoyltransferase HypF [Sulfuriflexus mobilis]|uniref:carbamoyltransferase HypF n=1 Tax=Sulfuriflexus mobilis TaxID=1811807 RepID=UPI000F82ED7D|nr:carbamoyltransferase HypF [Sulfuriflexus mobilis]
MLMEGTSLPSQTIQARHFTLTGHVQGVGFRPFVYRLAHEHNINGWVENQLGQVVIHAEGRIENLQAFKRGLIEQAPLHASPLFSETRDTECKHYDTFSIRRSNTNAAPKIRIVADLPTCDSCLQELADAGNRRFHYPFINCTGCGPRYTLIRHLPYDRANTTMAEFALCPNCRREYENPLDRRFHAEPIACPTCGPQLSYKDEHAAINDTGQALAACVRALRFGNIVAVKGIGGYHLMCDARSDEALQNLRRRKSRPDKPLAVMMLDTQLDEHVEVPAIHRQLLFGAVHPITLLTKKPSSTLSQFIAPGLHEIGIMLPYSPLHHLLVQMFGGPLVATSANISGEPVLTINEEVDRRLKHVTDACLHHNRAIQRPADDPVYRVVQNKPRPLRLGRGNAPLELTLPFQLESPLLAVGGHMKNTVALAWDDRIVISPHIGDLDSLRSQQVFAQAIDDLQELYRVKAQHLICDAHPGYSSSRWAQNSGRPVHTVYHHHAHAACLAGEFPDEDHWLVFTWDGVGLGADRSLWGGEALLGKPGHWQHVASMRPFYLPGGERASREPWRSAAALCWESSFDWQTPVPETELIYQAWQSKLNCPQTSSVGRLFDAAAALSGLACHASFEGQGPMLLEAAATQGQPSAIDLPLQQDTRGIWRTDWSPLLPLLADSELSIADRARCFHESLANALLQQAMQLRKTSGKFAVGLSGGVFQNRLLTERVISLLETNNFRCYLPEQLPVNDAGLCYGQVMEYHSTTE